MAKPWKKQLDSMETSAPEKNSSSEDVLFTKAEIGDVPFLDLHEAIDTEDGTHKLEQFLDQQFLSGVEVLTIVHGRGSGRMRKSVHLLLENHSHVKAFRDSEDPRFVLGATHVVLNV